MKAYCINLDRRPDRMDYMAGEFARRNIPFERVAAVDAADPDIAAAAAACPPTRTGHRMAAGAYGCFQSHREVWRRLLASGDAHAMVFEDDVLLAPDMAGLLDDGWVPADAALVKLETWLNRIYLGAGRGLPAGARRLHRLRSFHTGTGCYVISAAAARDFLGRTETFSEPVDHFLFDDAQPFYCNAVTYQMLPAPVIQGDRAGVTGAGWAATSITAHYVEPGARPPKPPETPVERLRRRLSQEVHCRLRGLRYVSVPHG